MKKLLLLILFISAGSWAIQGQVYVDQFDDDSDAGTSYGNGLSGSESNGEWTITGDGTGGPFEVTSLIVKDDSGNPTTVDITGNDRVFVRAKASNLGTQFRMDVKDADGYATTLPGFTRTLVNDYVELEFIFTDNYLDGGYGGTSCEPGTGPCPVDGSNITNFDFYINPGQPGFGGSVVIDYVAVGTEPSSGPMSDIFQDQFESENSLNYMGSAAGGLENLVENGTWIIRGNGTSGLYEPVNFLFHNTTSGDTTDVSVGDGDDKVFIRMRSTIPGTSVRLDLMDVNDFATTAGSITKIVTDEFATYEYNFSGSYQDLAFGGTGCEPGTGPCPVDADRVSNMIIFPDAGQEAYSGDVIIDYISVGTPLEAVDPDANTLVYGDHFSDNGDFVNTSGSFGLEVENSILKITGSGGDAPFTAVSYATHDNDSGQIAVDATGNNKVFIRAKSDAPNTLLRVDLVDTAGFVTTLPSFTRLLDSDFSVLEIDFAASYTDAGYGGTECETGPCPVNAEAISLVLLYPNAVDGGFTGNIEIDYISFGAPMGEDVFAYSDQFDDGNRDQWSDAPNFTVNEADGELIITGDGMAGPYTAFNYTPHDQDTGEPLVLDMTSNNKLYMKVKSTVANTPIRVDLVDTEGFATTEPSRVAFATEEYTVLEWDFSGTYSDAGYGGTACEPGTGPCPVDGTIIGYFTVFIDADNGGFGGTVTIDWLSTLEPLETVVTPTGPTGLEEYADEFNGDGSFISGNNGQTVEEAGGVLSIVGDGTSGPYDPIVLEMHQETDTVIVNAVANNDKLYIFARSTVGPTELRIDLQDNGGFVTSQGGVTQVVSTDYEILEYDYAGKYVDGGFGGTECMSGPCPVDGERVAALQLFLDPGVGAYNGTMEIDWISYGSALMTNVVDPTIASEAKVYPNPVRGELYLDMQTLTSGQGVATFVDMMGRTASQQSLGLLTAGRNNSRLTTTELPAGLYTLNITIDGKYAYNVKVAVK